MARRHVLFVGLAAITLGGFNAAAMRVGEKASAASEALDSEEEQEQLVHTAPFGTRKRQSLVSEMTQAKPASHSEVKRDVAPAANGHFELKAEALNEFPEEFRLRHAAAEELHVQMGGVCSDNPEDSLGLGCEIGCRCTFMQQCYLKSYRVASRDVNATGKRIVNVGVCELSIPILVAASIAILLMLLVLLTCLRQYCEGKTPPDEPGVASAN
mmetsp:Transcript_17846/g.41619  ORF Transcript_17846/g.41619 Transcript_17846/m.41619 type:complete len:213 (+) Transcript_17846:102-740(+)